MFLNATMRARHVAYGGARREVNWNFWEIGAIDVNHGFACRTMDGTHSKHYVRSLGHLDNVHIELRELSCSCASCRTSLNGNLHQYLHMLLKCNTMWSRIWYKHMGSWFWWEWLRNKFSSRGWYCSKWRWSTKFYILQCAQPMHIVVEETLKDDWGLVVEKRDEIVIGRC